MSGTPFRLVPLDNAHDRAIFNSLSSASGRGFRGSAPVCVPGPLFAKAYSGGRRRVQAPARALIGPCEPRDLRNATLLHSLARIGDWRLWLNAAGAADVDADRGLKFESSAMAYLAAAQGMGIAMAQGFLVQDELRRGALIKVFPQTVQSDRTYYLLSSPRYLGHPALEVFRDWLLAQLPNSSIAT